MSTSNLGLGTVFPKMLPVTGTWAVPISLYSIFLAQRIVYYRLTTKTFTGEKPAAASDDPNELHPMYRASRSFTNYMEWAPLSLALAGLLELNGANKQTLNYALGTLFALRVLHLEGGIMAKDTMGVGRPIGFYGTQAVLVGSALYLGNLVKGYWGF